MLPVNLDILKVIMPIVKPVYTLIILLFQRLWNTDGGVYIYMNN